MNRDKSMIDEHGSVSIGPIGIKPTDDGWIEAGYISEDNPPKITPIYPRQAGKITAATNRPAVERWLAAHGMTHDAWQRRMAQHYFGTTEAEYIRARLNTRLQGEDPGPYQRDPLHR